VIFTFYSFKGGVGRSMALANVAELLYQRGLNVLMIDFDLEAPGLERFFSIPAPPSGSAEPPTMPVHADIIRSRGVIDLLISYKALRTLPEAPASKTSQAHGPGSAGGAGTVTTVLPFLVEPLENFIVPIRGPTEPGTGSLSLMPAGRRHDNEYSVYASRVRAFDWDNFFT
jgi:hypothetical protein